MSTEKRGPGRPPGTTRVAKVRKAGLSAEQEERLAALRRHWKAATVSEALARAVDETWARELAAAEETRPGR